MLKVRQNWNDFSKTTFPPNPTKQIQFYYNETCFCLFFWRKLRTPKRHFEINWPLTNPKTIIYDISERFLPSPSTSFLWMKRAPMAVPQQPRLHHPPRRKGNPKFMPVMPLIQAVTFMLKKWPKWRHKLSVNEKSSGQGAVEILSEEMFQPRPLGPVQGLDQKQENP